MTIAAGVGPVNGAVPVSMKYAEQASEYWSARPSRGPPAICSGEPYDMVPTIMPVDVRLLSPAIWRAIPKSARKIRCAGVSGSASRTLAGLTSRWSNPL